MACSDDGDGGSVNDLRSLAEGNNQPRPRGQSDTDGRGCKGECGGWRKASRQLEEAKIPLEGKN
eukprot:CAMPEP_0171390152 /NCGR_PEP_ID=MMETSP0880-20121228/456_1 /TAXON_ID=67004 /ORGANISM="Thalassiosira weissflogii, Strain CCMP1336" /LENGTH=63 /DNA_ID=CAMNT_0011902595 /DNA_START=241 /DNA_END=432 /DNA_ORIENTATION=+